MTLQGGRDTNMTPQWTQPFGGRGEELVLFYPGIAFLAVLVGSIFKPQVKNTLKHISDINTM